MDANQVRANDLAQQIALAELIRLAIGELCFTADRKTFRRRMSVFESTVIDGLNRRRIWKEADGVTEAYIKEAASGYVTRLLASVRHPDDSQPDATGSVSVAIRASKEAPMEKQQQFLWIVQTMILTNSINLASIPEEADKYRHSISYTGAGFVMCEAVWASERIPDEMEARDAAHEFCTYMLANLREQDEKATSEKLTVPYWFARH